MNTIPVLQKAIAMVEAIAASPSGCTAKWLSLHLGVPPATCYRILRTLAEANWLRENQLGEMQVGFGMARVARGYADLERQLAVLAGPMRVLCEETGLSAKISLREGNYVLTVLREEARRLHAISSPVGTRIHLLEAGSAGIMLMAGLPAVEKARIFRSMRKEAEPWYRREIVEEEIAKAEKTGVAEALGTVHASIHAMSARLDLHQGQPVAVSIVGWPDEFTGKLAGKIRRKLRESVARMQKALDEDAGE